MANRAINHHIVPEVIQRQFSIDGDIQRVWRAKKDSSGSYIGPEKKLIEKTFVIRDYYTILENDRRSDLIERKFYGRIDDFLGRLLPKIIPIINSGEIPSFTSESLDSIRTIMMHMTKRTPDFLKGHDDTKLGRELVESTLSAMPNDTPSWQIERLEADLADATRLRDRGRDIRVTATLKNSKLVE